MKKTYIIPELEEIEIQQINLLTSSDSIKSLGLEEDEIIFGGLDSEGALIPD